MNASRPLPLFLALVLAAVVYVLLTSRGLPPVVASQFDGAGAANGFMRRGFYIGFMLTFVAGLPLLVVGLSTFLFRQPHAKLGIPNQAYWLAPDRRQETVDFLCQHMARFGSFSCCCSASRMGWWSEPTLSFHQGCPRPGSSAA
jgi:hypothetical protein